MSPYNAPKTIADRVAHTRTDAVPEGAGNMILRPTGNYEENWGFFSVTHDGMPEGFTILLPEPYDGRMLYMSAKDRGTDTLAAQTASPVPATQPSYIVTQPWVAGPPPPPKNLQANIAQPRQPTIQLVASGIHGFDAGDYILAWTRMDSKRRHTPPSPGLTVTVPTDGYSIRVTPPAGPHQGDTEGIGIWLSSKNGSYSDIALQYIIDISGGVPSTYLLSGPYRFGLRPAGFGWANRALSYSPWVVEEHGEFDVETPVRYRFAVHYLTADGRFTHRTGFNEFFAAAGSRRKTQWRVFPSAFPSWATGWRCIVGKSWPNTPGYWEYFLAYNTEWGDPLRPMPVKAGATLKTIQASNYEIIGGGAIVNGQQENVNSKWRLLPASYFATQVPETVLLAPSGDPNSSDPTIMEIPDSPLEDATTEGTQVITPGKYWLTVANTARGRIGPPATPQRITVNSGQVPRILFPSATNYFPNAEGIETDRSGNPYDHGIFPGSGSIKIGGGEIAIATGGPLTSGAPKHTLRSEVLQTDLTYDLEIAANVTLNLGVFTVWVEQYDGANALISRQALKAINASGTYQISATFRAATGTESAGVLLSSGDTITFATGLYQLQLSHEMTGASFDMTVTLSDIILSDADVGRPRRRAIPPTDSFDTADTNPSKQTPLAVTSEAAVEPPPSPPAYTQVATTSRLDFLDFETGVLPSSPWVKFQNTTSNVTFTANTAAALSGQYGMYLSKGEVTSNTSIVWQYLARQFGSDQRSSLAIRFSFEMRDTHYQKMVSFLSDMPTYAQEISDRPIRLCDLLFWYNQFGIRVHNPSTSASSDSWFTRIQVRDRVDVEMIAKRDPVTGVGSAELWLGVNGARRTLVGTASGRLWGSLSPRAVIIGAFSQLQNEGTFINFYDNIVVTSHGDSEVGVAAPVTPITLPDRPSKAGVVLDTTNFEGNSIPVAWTQVQTGTGTTLAVQSSSAITGSYGLRVADTNSSTANSVYIERTIPGGARSTVGFADSYKLIAIPSSGSANIFSIGEVSGQQLITASIDSSGNLYTQGFKVGGGAVTPLKQVNKRALVNGDIITIEAIPTETGTLAGTLSVYVTLGGIRDLMYQASALDWSASQALTVRAGIWGQSTNALTMTLDIDNLITTEAGTSILRETSADGRVINQAHVWIEEGIAPTSNLGLATKEPLTVIPGETYTGQIQSKAKIRPTVTDAILPYFMVAYRKDGARIDLGSLAGSGITASTGWQEYTQSFTIPDDCYEVSMESKNIVGGEYIAQEFVWVDGAQSGSISPERSFVSEGEFSLIFDRENPHGRLFSGIGVKSTRVASVVDIPDATSATVTYRSTNNATFGSWSEYVDDPLLLPDYRWIQVRIQMFSDGVQTPTVFAGSPIHEYALYGTTTQPVATLLREDGSELLGGVILSDFSFERSVSDWDIRKVRTGRSVAFRLSPPVMIYPDFKILTSTVDAMREIEEDCLAKPFIVEARGRRAQVRFTEQLKFEEKPHTYRVYDFEETIIEQMYGEAKAGRVEILEISDMVV